MDIPKAKSHTDELREFVEIIEKEAKNRKIGFSCFAVKQVGAASSCSVTRRTVGDLSPPEKLAMRVSMYLCMRESIEKDNPFIEKLIKEGILNKMIKF